MDGLSGAASVIAVVEISAKIISLCFQYSIAVKDAKSDIERIQNKLKDITRILEKIKTLRVGRDEGRLSTTHEVFESVNKCLGELKELNEGLEPRKTRKVMSRFGVRALKWPFTIQQVNKIVSNLEGYEQMFTLALQVDQTDLLLNFDQKIDLAVENTKILHHKLDLVKLPTAEGASFNSHAEEHAARCLPNTRTELLREIVEWAQKKDGKPIFWLSGMAGTGKSTIARTVAQSFADTGQLGASFFFKKGEGERGNASRFFATIATDLVTFELGMLPGLKNTLDADPGISQRALKDQFEKLILQPLLGMQEVRSQASTTLVVVIDALDECDRDEDSRAILQLLTQAKDIKPISLRILVTSRPELHIRLSFKQMSDGAYQDMTLHEVPKSTIEHDILVFLEHELGAIRQARLLSSAWPSRDQIQALVELAVPLFIFAATVCRYIGTKGGDPEEYLNKVLQYRKSTFSQLDRTYLPVLDQLLIEQEEDDRETWLNAFRELVGSIVVLQSALSVASLAALLRIPRKQVQYRLDSLHSLLSISDSQDVPVRLLHLSFREFLVDQRKQGKNPFWVNEKDTHKRLASLCLQLMSSDHGLRQNICDIMPGDQRDEISTGIIARALPPELQYACRYWVHHLEKSEQCISDQDSTHQFFQEHFLHWLEAMSLIGETNGCIHFIEKLYALTKLTDGAILYFLRDAKRFTLRFRYILNKAPLQIYSSALIFAPMTSPVGQTFGRLIPKGIKMVSKKEVDWNACQSTLEGHSDQVTVVVFSPNGQLVASGSDDGTVRLWEVATGTCRSTLEGHTSSINAVVFSLDSKLVASASGDKTVRLWDAASGAYRNTLEGHSDEVTTIHFSLDGQLIASASDDDTIRLWEVETGVYRSTLEGHSRNLTAVAFSSDCELVALALNDRTIRIGEIATGTYRCTINSHAVLVTTVAFSSDGQLVASGSLNGTVRLWETTMGTSRGKLKGHSDGVSAIAFSPDGRLVGSASNDATVRLWEVATGTCRSTLEGHTNSVNAIAFSPDGQEVASASDDWTVRVWELATGTCVNTLERHFSMVNDVVFSPDGRLIASASDDETIRLWEAGTGTYASKPEKHSRRVNAVTFSPDGQLVASASWADMMVRLWDGETGTAHSMLEGHCSSIKAIAFSPDSKLVASASSDKTVRVWDAATGECYRKLQGHYHTLNAVVFSPNGQLVASASADKTIRLWEVATGTCRSTLEGHSSTVNAVAFSPDGQLVVSASDDWTVRIWEVAMSTCPFTLEGHSDSVNAVVFSPDGRLVASASADKTIRLWDAATGTCHIRLEGYAGWTSTIAFSPDGQSVHTDRDIFPLDLPSQASSSSYSVALRKIFVEDQWMLENRQASVWLPPEYRPTCIAVSRDVVCLGLSSGRISLFKYEEPTLTA